ncbi:MAG TPA: hypothetical protein VFR38_10640 [Gaiellaceae bacterium]|nr:hypothetical protein [Gaiellaceae bacterium]
MESEPTHFAHREANGLAVDLFWDPEDEHAFRVEVADRLSGNGFVLFPRSGRAAVQAFRHPFAVELREERAPCASVRVKAENR